MGTCSGQAAWRLEPRALGLYTSLLEEPTRWVSMQEAVPVTRPLQNHLLLFTHLTTQDALWMPQYLQCMMSLM